jgi:hypothetical protein
MEGFVGMINLLTALLDGSIPPSTYVAENQNDVNNSYIASAFRSEVRPEDVIDNIIYW